MKQFALHIPEGVKDYIGEEAVLKEAIQNKVKQVFKTHSYNLIETPSFEYLDVFTLGEASFQVPSLYHLVSREGELMALRSDMTRAIARVTCSQNTDSILPKRYSYLANSFRYPKRYQGKLHEFTQAGIELIGNRSVEADAEVICVAIKCLKEAGVSNFTVHISSSHFLEYVVSDLRLERAEKEAFYLAIAQKDAVKVKSLLRAAALSSEELEVLLELIQCIGPIELLRTVKAKLPSSKAKQALEEMELLYQCLEEDGVHECVVFDFSLMNFGQYYTGMMFQVFTQEMGSAIVEGGRYDQLLKQFGRDLPAVGFGMHINLVLQQIIEQNGLSSGKQDRTLVVYTKETRGICQGVSEMLRRRGFIIENNLCEGIDEALNYAKAAAFRQVIYFTDKETAKVYHLAEDTDEVVAIDQIQEVLG